MVFVSYALLVLGSPLLYNFTDCVNIEDEPHTQTHEFVVRKIQIFSHWVKIYYLVSNIFYFKRGYSSKVI